MLLGKNERKFQKALGKNERNVCVIADKKEESYNIFLKLKAFLLCEAV